MTENEKTKKQKILALICLAVSALVLLILLPIGEGLNPLRRVILLPLYRLMQQDKGFLHSLGNAVYSFAVLAAAGLALQALHTLLGPLAGKLFPSSVAWGPLLLGGVLCLFGAKVLFSGSGTAFLVGLGLLSFGLWEVYKVFRSARNARVLAQDGETVLAEIVNITHGSISSDDGYACTVTCRADNRYYSGKTRLPLDSSYIGKKIPVRVSAGSPDVYELDFGNIIWKETKAEDLPDPVPPSAAVSSAPAEPPVPSGAAAEASLRRDAPEAAESSLSPSEAEPAVREAEEEEQKPYTPWDWVYTREYLRIPYPAFLAAGVFLLLGFFFSSLVRAKELTVFLFFALPGFLILLIEGLKLLRQRSLYRDGRQVRARLRSATLRYTVDGDPVYQVVCSSENERFSGKLRLSLKDPELVGKWVTVFVSQKNPKRFLIEGQTVSSKYVN